MSAASNPLDVALVSQMRAGTHYMCAALRLALEARLLRPHDDGAYGAMDDEDILKDMHAENRPVLPPARAGRNVYFSHYYHPHHDHLPDMPRVSLIGFPLDSFYSDGVVYSDENYTAGPSVSRPHAGSYIFRRNSAEWSKLEERMQQNAQWLEKVGRTPSDLVVRYEDLCGDFPATAARIESHLGGFFNPMPAPVINRKRTYWTRDFAGKFDADAKAALKDIFGSSLSRFYPECQSDLR